MSDELPLNNESSYKQPQQQRHILSPAIPKKLSYSQFPVPPGAPPWQSSTSPPNLISPRSSPRDPRGQTQAVSPRTSPLTSPRTSPQLRRRAMNENGRISPYTLSVAAEFSLKRANQQLLALGETIENVKLEFSPTRTETPRLHSRSNSEPIGSSSLRHQSPGLLGTIGERRLANGGSASGYAVEPYSPGSGDMLNDMRRLATELKGLRESIDSKRLGRRGSSTSSIASTSRGSTPLTSPRNLSITRLRSSGEESGELTPRTSPRHSRQGSLSTGINGVNGLQTVREVREEPVIEVQTMRGNGVGQPSAVVRIFRSTSTQQRDSQEKREQTRTPISQDVDSGPGFRWHGRSISESNGIRIRQYDYRSPRDLHTATTPATNRIREASHSPSKWRSESRPSTSQSMISEASYHTAFDTNTPIPMVETEPNGRNSYVSDHISDTATIGRPVTPPVKQMRSIGINTDVFEPQQGPPLPMASLSPSIAQTPSTPHSTSQPQLRERPSRLGLLSNIRGCQDGIVIAKLHAAIDRLAVQLAATTNGENSAVDGPAARRRMQTALELLEHESVSQTQEETPSHREFVQRVGNGQSDQEDFGSDEEYDEDL